MKDTGHEYEHHGVQSASRRALWWALIINLIFLAVEVVGGLFADSLALLADAGHMLTDVAALALALFVSHLAQRPATPGRTYGLLRAEVLGAFVNGAALVLIVGLIFWEAVRRLGRPEAIDAPLMLGVAFVGLLANLGSAKILEGGRESNVNVEGAFLHMAADALGSIGAVVAGAVIWASGWDPIDSIASMAIGLLILWSVWGFLKRTVNILLEATPEGIDFLEVKRALEEMSHIEKVHDLHIWTITSGMPVLTGHIVLDSCCCNAEHWQDCLESARTMLQERFGITHSTLQIEQTADICSLECQPSEGGDGRPGGGNAHPVDQGKNEKGLKSP